MSVLTEAILDSFVVSPGVTWGVESTGVVLASFTSSAIKARIRFVETGNEWQADFEVDSEHVSATQLVAASIGILNGEFQAVREFLEVRRPMKLVFSSEYEALGGLYETYLGRQTTTLSQLGYEMRMPLCNTPQTRFEIENTTPSARPSYQHSA